MTRGLRARRPHSGPVRFLLAFALLFGLASPASAASQAPRITATGAIAMDAQTGEVYYAKNADEPRAAASMTKVMSLYIVFEEIAAGRLSMDSAVTVSQRAARMSCDSAYSGKENLRAGGSYRVEDLVKLTIIASACGSTTALAEHIGGGSEEAFVERMNRTAEEWNIDAHFGDSSGWEDEGNAVSPRAMATIAQRFIAEFPQILEYSCLKSTAFQGNTFTSTNNLLRSGSVEGVDGLKTGMTYEAGYCFTGTAERNGRRIITVVMNSSDASTRMTDSQKLLEYGFARQAEREELAFAGRLDFLGVALYRQGSSSSPFTLHVTREFQFPFLPDGTWMGRPVLIVRTVCSKSALPAAALSAYQGQTHPLETMFWSSAA